VYAAWFKTKIESWPKRIFSLGGNHAVLNALSKPVLGGKVKQKGIFKPTTINMNPAERCKYAVDILTAALENSQYAAAIIAELGPLLFPGRSDIQATDIAQALHEMTRQYRGGCG
jgi:hypothetical protein